MPVADADRIERKLTTILAADVEGYSRLMAADEVAAMAALKDARAVFARLIERHRGLSFTGRPLVSPPCSAATGCAGMSTAWAS